MSLSLTDKLPDFFSGQAKTDEILILPNAKNVRDGYQRVLIGAPDPAQTSNDLSQGKWRKHPLLVMDEAEPDYAQRIAEVLDSWDRAFFFVEEDPARNVIGLRRPQIGGIHAAHVHWTVSDSPATIVMPTGTGKTETMLSILVSMKCEKLLVIVPTDALRTQTGEEIPYVWSSENPRLRRSERGRKYSHRMHAPAHPFYAGAR